MARRMSTRPPSANLKVPPSPMTNATTSSVALATRLGAPSRYIIPGTPMKPPTAMVEARRPVRNPSGSTKSTETRTFATRKVTIVPGISTDCTHCASGEVSSTTWPPARRAASRATNRPTIVSTIMNARLT